jgi:arylsulfatase A-like enzyme
MRILILDLDTLRADHLGCYGYHRNTSPNLDLVAREGVRFENYHCSDAPCLPSRAAWISGRFGIQTGVVGHGGTAADMRLEGATRNFRGRLATESLWSLFRSAGMRVASVSPFAERHGAWWFHAGCTEVCNPGRGGMESAEEVTPIALDWIARNARRPDWVLHVNYWDPHTPYRAPAEFGNPFEKDPLPKWLTAEVLAAHRKLPGPHKPREISMFDNRANPNYPRQPGELKDLDDLRRMIDGYDCGIRYMDEHLGRLFAAMRTQGVFDDLAILVTADHGENQGELGIYGEHATADRPTTRLPMLVRWPGARRGAAAHGLHYSLDLAPTLAELLGKTAAPNWEGRSYAGTLLRGEDYGRPYLVLSQCAHVCQRSVRFGPWLYMRTYHDGFHLFPDEMLYNLEEDPHEQQNLAGERREVCAAAAARLQEWHAARMASIPGGVDPLWTVIQEGGPAHARGRLKRYCEYLEATERGWAVPELRRRHPREFA